MIIAAISNTKKKRNRLKIEGAINFWPIFFSSKLILLISLTVCSSMSFSIAEAPELPGCASDGATYQEAIANLEVIIQEWIETARDLGRIIPERKGRLVFA